jgi:hypothetical protein
LAYLSELSYNAHSFVDAMKQRFLAAVFRLFNFDLTWTWVALPVFFVHLRFPLLTITYGLSAFFRTVVRAQWFIKRGSSHPLDAIGIVASAVVFVGAAVWQGVSYLVLR